MILKQIHGTINYRVIQPASLFLNRSAKTEQWFKNTLFRFCSVVEKTEQMCKKRNSGTKTHCSVFLFRCRNNGTVVQKTEQKCKNGTVVQKHTVPFFVRLWKNGTVVQKNGTVVQKHTVPFFCSGLETTDKWFKKRNRSAKTEQWYKNTLFRFLFGCGKTEQWCKKRNSGTKTHCSVFVLLWKKRNRSAKNGTVVQKHTVPFFVPVWKKRNSGSKNGTVVQKNMDKSTLICQFMCVINCIPCQANLFLFSGFCIV